jgi:hypothetical protein
MPDAVSPALFVVLAEPPAAREAEFHNWYDRVHGPDAIDNGSFNALHRYRAAGPGWREARYLALWEGDYGGEPEAWAYIRPRAEELRDAGRVGDVASVVFALMMFSVPSPPTATTAPGREADADVAAAGSLVTVQNDWRHPDPDRPASDWWKAIELDDTPPFRRARLYTSDPDGSGGGLHLALFEPSAPAGDGQEEWSRLGAPGISPTPPYQTIFLSTDDTEAQPHRSAAGASSAPTDAAVPDPADAWVMRWEHVSSLTGRRR